VNADAAVRAWIDAWDRAWRTKDPEALTDVYAREVVFRSHPFRDPQDPRDYASGAFAEEGDELDLWWGRPIAREGRAVIEWWAILTEDAQPVTLAGASLLEFDEEGHVVDQHDYWATRPGRVQPWAGWGSSSEA
jgi:hypothetical protein